MRLTKGVLERVRWAEITARHEVDGTNAEAMATNATKRAMMNFMVGGVWVAGIALMMRMGVVWGVPAS